MIWSHCLVDWLESDILSKQWMDGEPGQDRSIDRFYSEAGFQDIRKFFVVMVRNWKILLGDLLFEYGFLSCEQVAHSVSHEAKDFDVERIAVFFFILHLIRDKLIGTCEPFSLEIVFAFKVVGYTEVSKYEL